MQITTNTSGMLAGLTVFTDKDGRDYCVVVVKGTFDILENGDIELAAEQEPFVYADKHYGDPGTTSIQYECDFAPFKPRADVLVNGFAFSPGGAPTREMLVGFSINEYKKVIKVFGNRHWDLGVIGHTPTEPEPFLKMPLTYERAFGGSDQSDADEKHWDADLRNLVGKGFYVCSNLGSLIGNALPNLENPKDPIIATANRPDPACFAGLSRGWQPRIKFAGTYDQKWLDQKFPFLPDDFAFQYFQSAPLDQQLPYLQGGELVRCANMTPNGAMFFTVPRIDIPVAYRFRDRTVNQSPNLDTLIIEPDRHRFIATWRTFTPLGRKIHALREITVGNISKVIPNRTQNGKPHFASIDEMSAWKKNLAKPSDGSGTA